MKNRLKVGARNALNSYPRWVTRREFAHQRFVRFNERPVELAFLYRQLSRLYPRTVLDVGTGTTALPSLLRTCGFVVTATDNVRDYWPAGMFNRHYHVVDDDITQTRITERFDLICCISVLEHIERADDAVANMFGLLNPGGHLVLTCPYTELRYVRNVYELPGSSYGQNSPFITQSYDRSTVERWLGRNTWELIEQEFWHFWQGGAWTVGEQIIPPQSGRADSPHELTCLLMRRSG